MTRPFAPWWNKIKVGRRPNGIRSKVESHLINPQKMGFWVNFPSVFQLALPNFEKLEGKFKASVNFVHEGFIYTKNNTGSLKTRLRCTWWWDGRKGTAFVPVNLFRLKIKCQHETETSDVKKRKVESEIKNTAGRTCTPLKQIYDSHVTIKSKIQPLVKMRWAMGKRRNKII